MSGHGQAWPAGATRAAEPRDAAEVARLAGLMYAAMGVPVQGAAGWPASAEEAVRLRPGDGCRIEVLDWPDALDYPGTPSRLVACAAVTVAWRLPGPLTPDPRVGYVQWVCTDPAWRRQGCARAVTVAVLDWLADRGVSTVELHATAQGEGLYRALGFSDAGPIALRRRPPASAPRPAAALSDAPPSPQEGHTTPRSGQ